MSKNEFKVKQWEKQREDMIETYLKVLDIVRMLEKERDDLRYQFGPIRKLKNKKDLFVGFFYLRMVHAFISISSWYMKYYGGENND